MIPAMRLFAALALLALIVLPASAIVITAEPIGGNLKTVLASGETSYEYDATPEGRGIQRVTIDVPTGTQVDFTLTYGDGSTVTGSYYYHNDGFFRQTSEIELGSASSTYTYTGLEQIGRAYITGYAKNETSPDVWQSGFVIYGSTAGLSTITNDFVFYSITGDPVIYKFQMTSNNPVSGIAIMTNPREEVSAAASKSFVDLINEFVELAVQMAETIAGVITSGFRWLKFFFIDNLGMTVALYIAGSLAIAARTSRGNPIRVLKQFFKDQKALFTFIIEMWGRIVELLANIRGIFRI